jgi:hypothetical protein
VFRDTPNCLAIARPDNRSDRCYRRISAQSSTVITLLIVEEWLTIQPQHMAQYSTADDTAEAPAPAEDAEAPAHDAERSTSATPPAPPPAPGPRGRCRSPSARCPAQHFGNSPRPRRRGPRTAEDAEAPAHAAQRTGSATSPAPPPRPPPPAEDAEAPAQDAERSTSASARPPARRRRAPRRLGSLGP